MNTDNFDAIIKTSGNKFSNISIVARWHDEYDYLAYTDGTKNDDDLNLLVNRYTIKDNKIELEEISDEVEWERVNKFLNSMLYEGKNA